MARYKPWPVEAQEPYAEIVKRQSVIASMIDIAIEEGIKSHNKEIVKRLAPLIYKRAREIQGFCNDILAMFSSETGRLPKWYTTTEAVLDKALSISELVDKEIGPALKRNEMIYIASLLRCLKIEAAGIKNKLEESPYRAGLEVWEDAVRKALDKK